MTRKFIASGAAFGLAVLLFIAAALVGQQSPGPAGFDIGFSVWMSLLIMVIVSLLVAAICFGQAWGKVTNHPHISTIAAISAWLALTLFLAASVFSAGPFSEFADNWFIYLLVGMLSAALLSLIGFAFSGFSKSEIHRSR